VRLLITPALLVESLPGSEITRALVEQSRAAIAAVLQGHDNWLLVVVGPCSIHDHDEALQYVRLFKGVADKHADALLIEIVEMGMPVGTEYLDLLSPQFLSDLSAWGAIGARTTESQSHRQLASGLSCPVGCFKNGTDGSLKVATDAIVAAAAPHAFMSITKMGQAAIFETRGNGDCHVILRGGRAANYSDADARRELKRQPSSH